MQSKEIQKKENVQAIIHHLMDNPRLIRQYEFEEDLFFEKKDQEIFNSIVGINKIRDNYDSVSYDDIVSWIKRDSTSSFDDYEYLKECSTAHSLSFEAEYKEFIACKFFREAKKIGLKVDNVLNGLEDVPFSSINTVDWLNEYTKKINHIQDKYSGSTEQVSIVDAEDLDVNIEEDDEDWLIDGVFKKNSFNSITAEEKIGKTQLVNQLATAVTNGIDFFHYHCEKGTVIVVDFELTEKEIKRRAIDCKLKFYQDEKLKTFKTFPVALAFTKHTLDWVVNQVEEYCINNPDVKLIIFDCLFRFIRGSLNDAEDVERALSQLKVLQKYACVCFVHHHSGKSSKDVSAYNYGSGSTVLGWMPDEFITMQPYSNKDGDNRVVINIKGRHMGNGDTLYAEKKPELGWYFEEIDNPKETKESAKESREGIINRKEQAHEKYPEICEILDANNGEPVSLSKFKNCEYFYQDKGNYNWKAKAEIKNCGYFKIDLQKKTITYK